MSLMSAILIPDKAKVEEGDWEKVKYLIHQASNMSTAMMTDPVVLTTPSPIEVDYATCDCCGLREEYTIAYIQTIRERYHGKWICGLCAEAVEDEVLRCQRLISPEEALSRHFDFCKTFQSSSPPHNPTLHLIAAMRHVLRKSLDSPKLRSMPCSPMTRQIGLTRSESCIPTLSFVDSSLGRGCE